MKKWIVALLILSGTGLNIWSQELLGFESISGNDRNDFIAAEPKALEAANFLLSTAIDSHKTERDKYLKFMVMWMEGTPDYVFYIDSNIGTYTHSSNSLMAIYMAGVTKLCLEKVVPAGQREELKFKAVELFLDYCTDPSKNVKPYNQLEKLLKAREKGLLREYIEE